MASIIRFVIFLALIVAAVVGGYYYFSVKQNHDVVKQQVEMQLKAQAERKIPAGAVMEDGTVGE